MSLSNIQTILISGGSVGLGAIYGGLRSKIFASKTRGILHYPYYLLSVGLLLVAGYAAMKYNHELFYSDNRFALFIWFGTLVVAIGLFFVTKKYLIVKDIYKTSELDPIVNKFTAPANKDKIKLFGGDLNFLGNNPQEMDNHPQYIHLKSMDFRRVLILCALPHNNIQKIRYGKIIYDFRGAELKFYRPDEADLKLRGRIITVGKVSRLLMYSKVASKVYQAIQTDVGDSSGALYNGIWELVWSLARPASNDEITEYVNLFRQ
jgi:hypothetical protein